MINLYTIVSEQLPGFVRSQYPAFIEFVKAYYKWVNEQYPTTYVDSIDVDNTIEQFVKYFKRNLDHEGILDETNPYNTLYLKHIKEIYSSKGSEQALIKILKIVYNADATIDYPGKYILRASDGKWLQEKFITVDALYGSLPDDATHFEMEYNGVYLKYKISKIITVNDGYQRVYFTDKIVYDIEYDDQITVKDEYDTVIYVGKVIESPASIAIIEPGNDWQLGTIFNISGTVQDSICRINKVDDNGGIKHASIYEYGYAHTDGQVEDISELKGLDDVVLLWPSSQDQTGILTSAIGPDPTINVGEQYNEAGTSVGTTMAWHDDKGVWVGPDYENLIGAGYEDISLWTTANTSSEEIGEKYNSPIYRLTGLVTGPSFVYSIPGFAGTSATFSVLLKRFDTTRSELLIRNNTSSTNLIHVRLNWETLTTELRSGTGTFDLVHIGDDWYEFFISAQSGITSGNTISAYLYPISSSGIIGESVLACAPQVTATSVPMPYVLPGTTTNSVVSTSSDDGMYFDMAETPDGVELVYNGGFDTNTDGWSSVSDGILSVVNGKLHVSGNAGDIYYAASTTVSLIVGAKYRFTGVTIPTDASPEIRLGYYSAGSSQIASITSDGVNAHDFVAESSVLYITLYGTGDGLYTEWDNISVQRLTSPLMQCFEKSETDGVELVTNGTFDSDVTALAYVDRGEAIWIDGKAKLTTTSITGTYGVVAALIDPLTVSRGLHRITITISDISFANVSHRITVAPSAGQNSGVATGIFIKSPGTYSFVTEIDTGWTVSILTRDGVATIGDYFTIDNISVQKLKPATCTVAAEVTMGVGSGDSGDTPIMTISDTSGSSLLYARQTISRLAQSYDGTEYPTISSTWSIGDKCLSIVQTNADGTQFRVGYKRIGIDTAIQWAGVWKDFDGSFNPLRALRIAYGNTVPLWIRQIQVWNKGAISDEYVTDINTNGNSLNLVQTKIQLNTAPVAMPEGKWIDDSGKISHETIRIQDNYYYQLFSYVINGDVPTKKYINLVDTLNPAGNKYFTTYSQESSLAIAITGETLTPSRFLYFGPEFIDIVTTDPIFNVTKVAVDTAVMDEIHTVLLNKVVLDQADTSDQHVIDFIKVLDDSYQMSDEAVRTLNKVLTDQCGIDETHTMNFIKSLTDTININDSDIKFNSSKVFSDSSTATHGVAVIDLGNPYASEDYFSEYYNAAEMSITI